MKTIGLVFLVVGFIWIVHDTASTFVSYQHTRWIWQSKHLPAGESIPRSEAVSAMRELSLNLKNRHRVILIPTSCMLVGGLLIFFGRSDDRGKNVAEQVAASDC